MSIGRVSVETWQDMVLRKYPHSQVLYRNNITYAYQGFDPRTNSKNYVGKYDHDTREGFIRGFNGIYEADTVESIVEPLYVKRNVLNAEEIIQWARDQGFESVLAADDMHVTQTYSKVPVTWSDIVPSQDKLIISGDDRSVETLGDKGAIVLKFTSTELQTRWTHIQELGASWDYEGYTPHITLTYSNPQGIDPSTIEPYSGDIVLGNEIFEPLDLDWSDNIEEMSIEESTLMEKQPWDDSGLMLLTPEECRELQKSSPNVTVTAIDGDTKLAKELTDDDIEDTRVGHSAWGVFESLPFKGTEVTLRVKGDLEKTLPEFLDQVSNRANIGHSYVIVADEDDPFKVFIDADGAADGKYKACDSNKEIYGRFDKNEQDGWLHSSVVKESTVDTKDRLLTSRRWRYIVLDSLQAEIQEDKENNQLLGVKEGKVVAVFDKDLNTGVVLEDKDYEEREDWEQSLGSEVELDKLADNEDEVIIAKDKDGEVIGTYTSIGGNKRGINIGEAESHPFFGKAPKKGTVAYYAWKQKVNQDRKDFAADPYGNKTDAEEYIAGPSGTSKFVKKESGEIANKLNDYEVIAYPTPTDPATRSRSQNYGVFGAGRKHYPVRQAFQKIKVNDIVGFDSYPDVGFCEVIAKEKGGILQCKDGSMVMSMDVISIHRPKIKIESSGERNEKGSLEIEVEQETTTSDGDIEYNTIPVQVEFDFTQLGDTYGTGDSPTGYWVDITSAKDKDGNDVELDEYYKQVVRDKAIEALSESVDKFKENDQVVTKDGQRGTVEYKAPKSDFYVVKINDKPYSYHASDLELWDEYDDDYSFDGLEESIIPQEDVIGSFRELSYGRTWFYGNTHDKWALDNGLPHEIESQHGNKFAKVLNTVAYVAVDEDAEGKPVLEKWFIKHYSKREENNV